MLKPSFSLFFYLFSFLSFCLFGCGAEGAGVIKRLMLFKLKGQGMTDTSKMTKAQLVEELEATWETRQALMDESDSEKMRADGLERKLSEENGLLVSANSKLTTIRTSIESVVARKYPSIKEGEHCYSCNHTTPSEPKPEELLTLEYLNKLTY